MVRRDGFTLLEVVLAIGLAGVVLGLLSTAINLYLIRVDASRTQVESAQLARTLMQQIASDLRAARYYSPAQLSDDDSEESEPVDPALVQGIFGTATELRIDRSAVWNWDQVARQTDAQNPEGAATESPRQSVMPQTVRYVLGEGKELLAADLAKTGVSEKQAASDYAGLYREQISTSAWLAQQAGEATTIGSNDSENAKLIAPEVVNIEFAYFDGEQLLEDWDSSETESLPNGIEIKLTLLEEPFEQAVQRSPNERDELRRSKENLAEYRLFVSLIPINELEDAGFPAVANKKSPL